MEHGKREVVSSASLEAEVAANYIIVTQKYWDRIEEWSFIVSSVLEQRDQTSDVDPFNRYANVVLAPDQAVVVLDSSDFMPSIERRRIVLNDKGTPAIYKNTWLRRRSLDRRGVTIHSLHIPT